MQKNILIYLLLLFLLIRMFGITHPPAEMAHNWRETTVTMPARNFVEVELDLLRPRVDFAGEKTGITGMEFPFYNFLIYLAAKPFGYEHWYGRLINLLISSAGIWFFYLLLLKYISREWAQYAALILLGSLWFGYSRKIIPETLAASLVIMGLYLFRIWLEKPFWPTFLGFVVLCGLGALSKISAGPLLGFALIMLYEFRTQKSKVLWALLGIGLVTGVVVFWYFFWVPYLVNTYQFFHFYMGTDLAAGTHQIATHFPGLLQRIFITAMGSSGGILLLLGLMTYIRIGRFNYAGVWLILMAFGLIVVKTGFNFVHHSYYILPIIPVLALGAAYGLRAIPGKWRWLALLVLLLENGLRHLPEMKISKAGKDMMALEQFMIEAKVPGEDLVVYLTSNGNPAPVYFAHRKGWLLEEKDLLKTGTLDSLQQLGAHYVLVPKALNPDLSPLKHVPYLDAKGYRLFFLEPDPAH